MARVARQPMGQVSRGERPVRGRTPTRGKFGVPVRETMGYRSRSDIAGVYVHLPGWVYTSIAGTTTPSISTATASWNGGWLEGACGSATTAADYIEWTFNMEPGSYYINFYYRQQGANCTSVNFTLNGTSLGSALDMTGTSTNNVLVTSSYIPSTAVYFKAGSNLLRMATGDTSQSGKKFTCSAIMLARAV